MRPGTRARAVPWYAARMRRARSIVAALAVLALSGAASACALYFEEEPPGPPIGPAPDAGLIYPPPPPPPMGVAAEILIPGALQNEELFLDLVWSHGDKPMDHDLYRIGLGTVNLQVSYPDAVMLAATLYTADGQIVDAALFREFCPDYTSASPMTGILEVPFDYATINEAVAAAREGDIIYVHPGTYYEHIRLRPGVHLIGAGAHRTVLDGEGLAENLIDITGAAGAVVRGFTLRNVGARSEPCDSDTDALDCSGDWFTSAVYGDGHDPETYAASCDSSVVLMHNIIEASDTGVRLYYYATAAIRNNLFLDNGSGVIASYLHERVLLVGNTFDVAEHRFVAADRSSPLDASNNIFANAMLATETNDNEPDSTATCNVLFVVNDPGPLVPAGQDGNDYIDPSFRDVPARDYRLREESAALGLGCYGGLETSFTLAPGAYGGPLGDWYQRDITSEELKRFLE